MSEKQTKQSISPAKDNDTMKRAVGFIGTDNLSLMFALVFLVFLITIVSGWFGMDGGDKFFSLAKSHEQSGSSGCHRGFDCNW